MLELDVVEQAALACSTTEEMWKWLIERGYSISHLELRKFKEEHRIRCGPIRPGTLTHNGRTQTYEAWAAECGLRLLTLRKRLQRGWSTERALGLETQEKKRVVRVH